MKHNKQENAHGEVHSNHSFDNTELFSKRFDAIERDEWQKPKQVIDSLNLPEDATVLEIGAGTGYFTIRLAEYLKNGKVIALESSSKMVEYLDARIKKLSLSNVNVILSETVNYPPLTEKLDMIMCVDSYHHIMKRVDYFSDLKKLLNLNGKIVIIDRPKDSPVAPPHGHQTPPELIKNEMKQAGLELIQKFDFLLPHQFYLEFKPIQKTRK
ncbi:MAG: class I SAM-dependent methyltransferase [Candidatus Pacearchaeota archaeon]